MSEIVMAANPDRPVVLVHGYSDRGASFIPWANVLRNRGVDARVINIVTYKSLTNEVTIKDLAEGFDRALEVHKIAGEFDAIVHSTGMLVVRAWLTATRDSSRVKRLKHLIGLAPATWGSPLAHKGRGWLGAIFKGNKERGPDFLEAGDLILDGLELASRFTWDLAHRDLFGPTTVFGEGGDTPYPFVFCGNEDYKDLFRRMVNEPGTDGTVRFAGVSLDSRKLTLDLTRQLGEEGRSRFTVPKNIDARVVFVDGRNHGSILGQPHEGLANQVVAALNVSSIEEFHEWNAKASAQSWNKAPRARHQQFVIRLTDEREDPIFDYNLQLFRVTGGKVEELPDFDLDVHPYDRDKSYRCFHVDLEKLEEQRAGKLWARLTISSGTVLVGYRGYSTPGFDSEPPPRWDGESDADYELRLDARPLEINLDLDEQLEKLGGNVKFFHPYTTTLIDMKVNREPLPVGPVFARLCHFENWTGA